MLVKRKRGDQSRQEAYQAQKQNKLQRYWQRRSSGQCVDCGKASYYIAARCDDCAGRKPAAAGKIEAAA